MSGPKTSRYTLTAAQRRALQEQRRRELEEQRRRERISKAKSKLALLSAKTYGLSNITEEALDQARLLNERTGSDNGFAVLKNQLSENTGNLVASIEKANESDSVELLEQAVREAQQAFDDLSKLRGKLDGLISKNKQQLHKDIMNSLDSVADVDFSKIQSPAERQLEQRKDEIANNLSNLLSPIHNDELHDSIEKALKHLDEIDNPDFLSNFNAMTVAPLEKKCREYTALRQQIGDEYDDLMIRYTVLCKEQKIIPQNIAFERGAVEKLDSLITELEKAADSADEQSYISRCIDEVMEDMGYKLVGNRSVTKKSGRHFRNELYSFSEGTAVNVTYSDNGNITMELGGVDTKDRMPDTLETERLTEDMGSFCGQYREFERRLAEKGVVSNHISLLPPEPVYAQVINVSDYDMTDNIATIDQTTEQYSSTQMKEMRSDD
ncbi:MAG: hypothetical protein ACLVFU_03240 [Eggerthellaceae bacterium]|jgi:hypothetical protein